MTSSSNRAKVVPDAKWVTLGFGIALAVLAVVGVLAYQTISWVSETTAWVEHTHEVIDTLGTERAALSEAADMRHAHGLSGDDALIAAHGDAIERARASAHTLQALLADDAVQLRRLVDLEKLAEQSASNAEAAIDRKEKDSSDDALEVREMNAGLAIDHQLATTLTAMVADQLHLLAQRRAKTARHVWYARVFEIAGTIASCVILLFTFGRLRREIALRVQSERAARSSEQVARDSEESLATTLHSIGDGVISTDIRGRVARMNRVAAELTGWSEVDALGQPISAVFRTIDAETRSACPDPVAVTLRDGVQATLPEQTLLVRRDESEIPIGDSCAPVLDGSGTLRGAVLVFRDTREARRAKALQEAARTQMIAADRMIAIGTLAAGVAHEVNNPLAYVTANLDLIIEEVRGESAHEPPKRAAKLLEMVSAAREGATRVQKIVRGLKTFSRADEEHPITLNIEPVLELAISMVGNELGQRARLVRDYQPIPRVLADEARLGQVFINLLLNAAQAVPEGQFANNEIRVLTKTDSEGRAVVEIQDSGVGIAPAALGRIFDPFFTTKPIGVGTGLGLSISRNIVSAMKGEIAVSSEHGRGAVFRVVLPASLESVTLPSMRVAKPVGTSRAAVLVVDDERQVGVVLARVLDGHDVTVLTKAREALSVLATGKHFDVILADLMMPEMSGMDLYEELSRHYPSAAERVVFMTGGVFTAAAQAFFDRVPNARIGKPFDPNKVRALVHSLAQKLATNA
jgi:PAS domain S-box-containing protein